MSAADLLDSLAALKREIDPLPNTLLASTHRAIDRFVVALKSTRARRDDAVLFLLVLRPLVTLAHIPPRLRKLVRSVVAQVEHFFGLDHYEAWLQAAVRLSLLAERFHRGVVSTGQCDRQKVLRAAQAAFAVHEALGVEGRDSPIAHRAVLTLRDALDSVGGEKCVEPAGAQLHEAVRAFLAFERGDASSGHHA